MACALGGSIDLLRYAFLHYLAKHYDALVHLLSEKPDSVQAMVEEFIGRGVLPEHTTKSNYSKSTDFTTEMCELLIEWVVQRTIIVNDEHQLALLCSVFTKYILIIGRDMGIINFN